MGCSNSVLLTRFQVKLIDGCGANPAMPAIIDAFPDAYVRQATKVTGLSLGEEGEIEVPLWTGPGPAGDRKAKIADGIRTLPSLGIQIRVDSEMDDPQNSANVAGEWFAAWYNNRADTYFTVDVEIVKRDRSIMYTYRYVDCEFRGWTQEDQELGATKVALIDMTFSPNDVQLLNTSSAAIVA